MMGSTPDIDGLFAGQQSRALTSTSARSAGMFNGVPAHERVAILCEVLNPYCL